MQLWTMFGMVVVTPTGWREETTMKCQNGSAAYANVPTGNIKMSAIDLCVKVSPADEGTKIFVVKDGKAVEIGDESFSFSVPVKWDGPTPKTRLKGRDNIDVVILRPDGEFINAQCGLITRYGEFFLTAQTTYQGTVIRTRKGGGVQWDFAPSRSIHAYPGATYAGIWSAMADAVMSEAKLAGLSQRKSTALIAEWKPPALPAPPENGSKWEVGVVHYFNMITGMGEIQDSKGAKYFVHFSKILGEMRVPRLTPMTAVFFRPDPESNHDRQAVKSVKLPG
jgi:cold shock CspA family protein